MNVIFIPEGATLAYWSKLRVFLGFFFCWVLTISSAYADILDPIPLSNTLFESPPRESGVSEKKPQFFCPLSKNFYNDSDKIAAQTLLLEALGEGYEGMVAVGEVIRNREKLFLKDSKEVCLMPKQFSAWNDPHRAEVFLKKYHVYYFIAVMAWIESGKSSITNGATDYHTASSRPYWASAYSVAARIRHHIFYRRIDN